MTDHNTTGYPNGWCAPIEQPAPGPDPWWKKKRIIIPAGIVGIAGLFAGTVATTLAVQSAINSGTDADANADAGAIASSTADTDTGYDYGSDDDSDDDSTDPGGFLLGGITYEATNTFGDSADFTITRAQVGGTCAYDTFTISDGPGIGWTDLQLEATIAGTSGTSGAPDVEIITDTGFTVPVNITDTSCYGEGMGQRWNATTVTAGTTQLAVLNASIPENSEYLLIAGQKMYITEAIKSPGGVSYGTSPNNDIA